MNALGLPLDVEKRNPIVKKYCSFCGQEFFEDKDEINEFCFDCRCEE